MIKLIVDYELLIIIEVKLNLINEHIKRVKK